MKGTAAAARRSSLLEVAGSPLVALELMTVLRLRRPPIVADEAFGASQAWFPAVGLLIGGAAYALDELMLDLFPAALSGWLTAAFIVILTGALHLDGLADSVDGLFGGRTPVERRAIMKDSAIGSYGMGAVVLALGLKATAIGSLDADIRIESLVLAPCLARWASVVVIAAFPYARASGLGQAFHAHSFPWAAPVAAATTLVPALLLAGWAGLGLFAGAGVLALALGAFITRRINGVTGDGYGAVIEITEVLALLAFVAIGTAR